MTPFADGTDWRKCSRVYQLAREIEGMLQACVSVVGAALLALLSMTAMAETPPPTASGIEGTVHVSPARPGPITRDGPTVAPAANTRFVVKAADAVIATFTTDSEGRFQVALPPGRYVIVREGAEAVRIGRWRFEAAVGVGKMTKVKWTADSGMR
ncbi:hypothetical protein BH20VER1_BH20VER1_04900 [soil metagenome]